MVVVVLDFFSMLKGLPDPIGAPGGGVRGGCALFLWEPVAKVIFL